MFSRFGTRLDEETRRTLERGRRVREVFKQPQYEPLPVAEQIAVLFAAGEGILDELPLEEVAASEQALRRAVVRELPALCERMGTGAKFTADDREVLRRLSRVAVARREENGDANA